MDPAWSYVVFDDTFGFAEIHLGGSEKCRPNGLGLVCNGFVME